MADEALIDAPPTEAEDPESDSEVRPDYGPANKDLPRQLIDAIKSAITDRQSEEKYSRRREVVRDRRDRFFEAGYQHLSWNNEGCAIATPGGVITNPDGQSIQCPNYMDSYNIFGRYLLIIMSVLTQAPPGVNWQPIDPGNPDDNDSTKEAEKYERAFDRYNDIYLMMQQVIRMMGVSGRTVSWTRTETDAQKFGFDESGKPKSFQRSTIHGTLETKCPIMTREFCKDFSYILIYDDPDLKVAKDEYPDFADQIKAGGQALSENNYERTARLGVLVGSKSRAQIGDSLSHLCARVNAFLRTSEFTGKIYDEPFTGDSETDASTESMTVREKLLELFPQGCRAVFVGDVYVGSYAECMDDHIDIQFPYVGDGMSRPPFMLPIVSVQINFNILMNWIMEKIDTGAGSLWINATQEDVDAVTSQKAAPNAIRPWKVPPGMKAEDAFYKEPDPEIPSTLFEFLQLMKGELPEFLLAALPALQGSEMSENKTASGYAQATVQAKGQLGIIWKAMQAMFARIRYQSALAASRCDEMQGNISVPGDNPDQTISIDMSKLRKGNFGCYPDESSSFPESTDQKGAKLDGLLALSAQSPALQQLLDNPDNIEELKRYKGFDGLVFLPAEARQKQLHEIEILLQQEPIGWISDPNQLAVAQNTFQAASKLAASNGSQPLAPAPNSTQALKPSVPVDDLDYHQWEGAKGQEWLSSAERRQQDASGNQAGVMNVKLHTMEHLQRAAAMAMAAQQAAAPPAPPMAHAGPPHPPPHPAPVAKPAAPVPIGPA